MRALLVALLIAAAAIPAAADHVAFFYALESDWQAFRAGARDAGAPVQVGSRSVQRVQLAGHTVYGVKMGAGTLQTALSAQALLSRFRCDRAVSLGPAGALSDEPVVGSWHRVIAVLPWDRAPGPTDDSREAAYHPDWGAVPLSDDPLLSATSGVTLASGESFIATASARDALRARTGADAVDMNSSGLAVVCADHRVPLLVWKVISDHADEQAAADFQSFIARYRGEGGTALAAWLQALPPNPHDPATYPAIRNLMREDAATPPATGK